MKLSSEAEKELINLAESETFKNDMELLRLRWQAPFIKAGKVDVDAYIEFVQQFNEFINHQPKPFKLMIDKDMRL
jgi:hypothetical protein